MKRYKDYMDGVETSDALHEKLTNLEEPGGKPQPWVKWGAAAAALVLAAGVGAYGLSQSQGGWGALMENFKPAAEAKPEIVDVPAPFPMPDIANEDDPYAPADRTYGGGYEVIDGELASYYVLPYLDWADASALPQTALNYLLAPHGAIQRDAAWDDVLMFTGGEKAMADHLLWDGLNWNGILWFLEDGTPCAAELSAGGENLDFYLEVRKGHEVPSCVVVSYETSQWQGVEIHAVKNGGSAFIDGVELNEKREVSFFCGGVGYKLTLYSDDAARADELCARFVRYAVDGGFSLSVLPFREGDLPNKGLPPETVPTANILHPGDEGYVEPFPAPDGDVMTTPYDPSAPN